MPSSPCPASRWGGSRRPPLARRPTAGHDRPVPVGVAGSPEPLSARRRLDDYIADEHTIGRLLDLGVIAPRLNDLYRWSADELRLPPLCDLVRDATPAYVWDPDDRKPWAPPATRLVRAVRRALPSPP
jgi:hypothetical protein